MNRGTANTGIVQLSVLFAHFIIQTDRTCQWKCMLLVFKQQSTMFVNRIRLLNPNLMLVHALSYDVENRFQLRLRRDLINVVLFFLQ